MFRLRRKQTDSPTKVKNIGRLIIACNLFLLLGTSVSLPHTAMQGELGAFAHAIVLPMLCVEVWGLATGMGLLWAWRWARISMLVLCAVFTAFHVFMEITFIIMPSDGEVLLKWTIVSLIAIPIALGVWGFMFFMRSNVKAYFQGLNNIPTVAV